MDDQQIDAATEPDTREDRRFDAALDRLESAMSEEWPALPDSTDAGEPLEISFWSGLAEDLADVGDTDNYKVPLFAWDHALILGMPLTTLDVIEDLILPVWQPLHEPPPNAEIDRRGQTWSESAREMADGSTYASRWSVRRAGRFIAALLVAPGAPDAKENGGQLSTTDLNLLARDVMTDAMIVDPSELDGQQDLETVVWPYIDVAAQQLDAAGAVKTAELIRGAQQAARRQPRSTGDLALDAAQETAKKGTQAFEWGAGQIATALVLAAVAYGVVRGGFDAASKPKSETPRKVA